MKNLFELNEAQRRQLVDAESLFEALENTREEVWRHRGSMFWREQAGHNYLIKLAPDSRQTSLGRESDATRLTFERFMARKAAVEARLKDLREQEDLTKRLNKALRIGRTPGLLVDLLEVLAKARVSDHFLVVGTNALYAYESAAGVRLPTDVMETQDVDSLYDTRRRAEFVQVMASGGLSFMDLLRKVDKTFERHPTDNYTAVNSKGYEVDLIRRFPPPELETVEHPLQMTTNTGEDDIWSVAKFSQVVISTTGAMARMPTVHPMAFARIKRQLSLDPTREPLKATKDLAQAEIVEALVLEHLPQLAKEPIDAPAQVSEPAPAAAAAVELPAAKRVRARKP